MPTICRFLGIIVSMNLKPKEHNPPHIHVYCGGQVARVNIQNNEILSGEIPQNKVKLVNEFINAYRNELLEMWNSQKVYEIDY